MTCSSQQSEHDLSLLLHPSGGGASSAPEQAALFPAPAAEAADRSGQLLCEEGLELEDAVAAERGRAQRNMGAAECSPRSWDNASKDARCYSASTSDSQASEGALQMHAFLPAVVLYVPVECEHLQHASLIGGSSI